jgi:hypothetical protein
MENLNLNEKTKDLIDHLKKLNDPIKIIDDVKAYENLFDLNKLSSIRENSGKIDWNLYSENGCDDILAQILYKLNEISDKIDFDIDKVEYDIKLESSNLNARRKCMLIYMSKLINNILSQSLIFGIKFNNTIGVDAFILLLKNSDLIERIIKSEEKYLIATWCANLNWLSKTCEETLKKWQTYDTIKVLLRILELDTRIASLEVTICQTIVNIASDHELENMSEIQACISLHIKLLEVCAQEFRSRNFHREIKEYLNDENLIEKHEVHMVKIFEPSGYLTITSLLQVFCRISVNDKIRLCLYFNRDFKSTLKSILFGANLIELKFTLNLLAQLIFNETIRNDLLKDKELVNFLMINENEKSYEVFLKKVRQQIHLWSGKNDVFVKNDARLSNEQHVMISYNTASRPLCLKIKEKLESLGFKIWIDVEQIHGSSLDSMAKAVENSSCFLMCVTEKYRQSVNCQAEAQYAFKLNKKIIPLIMQNGYDVVQGSLFFVLTILPF